MQKRTAVLELIVRVVMAAVSPEISRPTLQPTLRSTRRLTFRSTCRLTLQPILRQLHRTMVQICRTSRTFSGLRTLAPIVYFGAELSIIWDYSRADGVTDLSYVFIAVIETDTSVSLVELITKKGSLIQITDEPIIEIDNVVTQFYEDGDVRVWQYVARFADAAGLKEYSKGDFIIAVHHDQGVDEAGIQYKSKGKYKYKAKHKPGRNWHDNGLHEQDDDPDEDDGEDEDDD